MCVLLKAWPSGTGVSGLCAHGHGIALLQSVGKGRLISDDHAARAESRKRGIRANYTIGVVAQLLTVPGSGVDTTMADTYLQTIQARERIP